MAICISDAHVSFALASQDPFLEPLAWKAFIASKGSVPSGHWVGIYSDQLIPLYTL